MTYPTSILSKAIITVGICFFAATGLITSGVIVHAEDPATPNTPGMGIPSNNTTTQATTNNPAPEVPVPVSPVVTEGAIIVSRSGVTTQNFKNDVVTPTTNGATNELKASDLTIQKSPQIQSTVDAVRTGAVPVFLLIVTPVAVMLWYQYRFIRSKKTSLATTEEKITTSAKFDKK